MRKNLLLASAILFSLFMSCSKDDKTNSSLCGSKMKSDKFWIGRVMMENFDGLPDIYMEGNNRVFQWSSLVENACPHEHFRVESQVTLSSPASPVSFRGRIDWLLFFERKFTMTRSGNEFKGNGEAGLKQAFGDDPASFFPIVEVYFPTKGSYSADSAFLLQQVTKIVLIADYLQHKP